MGAGAGMAVGALGGAALGLGAGLLIADAADGSIFDEGF